MLTLTTPLDNPPIQFTVGTNVSRLLHKMLMNSTVFPLQRVFSFGSLFSLNFRLVPTTYGLLNSKGNGNVRKV